MGAWGEGQPGAGRGTWTGHSPGALLWLLLLPMRPLLSSACSSSLLRTGRVNLLPVVRRWPYLAPCRAGLWAFAYAVPFA